MLPAGSADVWNEDRHPAVSLLWLLSGVGDTDVELLRGIQRGNLDQLRSGFKIGNFRCPWINPYPGMGIDGVLLLWESCFLVELTHTEKTFLNVPGAEWNTMSQMSLCGLCVFLSYKLACFSLARSLSRSLSHL